MTAQLAPPPVKTIPALSSGGIAVDADTVDWLTDSTALRHDAAALHQRLDTDGYLYLHNALPAHLVAAARFSVCEKLGQDGILDPHAPTIDAIWNGDKPVAFKPEYANGNPHIHRLLYGPEMLAIFQTLFAAPVAHYDFTWLRAISRGFGTPSHCDVVYMGRGETQRLYTVWTPLGDVDFAAGGLMVLEGSHRHQRLRETYGQHDVDTFCANKPERDGWRNALTDGMAEQVGWRMGGSLDNDLNRIRAKLGMAGKWRTGEFTTGDILLFSVYTIHASIDNTSNRVRLSTDSRYQPAGTALDERWVGDNPIAHSRAGKKGRVC